MSDTVHPYFAAKARAVFRRAQGDPDRSGPLAAWAEAVHETRDGDRRVLVAEDGTLVGEARYRRSRVGATYVTSVVDERQADLVGREVGLALGSLSRHHRQRVIMVTYSDVCVGQSPRERA